MMIMIATITIIRVKIIDYDNDDNDNNQNHNNDKINGGDNINNINIVDKGYINNNDKNYELNGRLSSKKNKYDTSNDKDQHTYAH